MRISLYSLVSAYFIFSSDFSALLIALQKVGKRFVLLIELFVTVLLNVSEIVGF